MSAPLEQTVCWNNEGAALLREGRLKDATLALGKAINIMLTCASKYECQGRLSFIAEAATLIRPSIHLMTYELDDQGCYNREGMTYIFDRPMLLKTKGVQIKSPEQYTQLLYTIGLHTMFNLALVHHVCGRLSGAEEPYDQARQLYKIVLAESIRMAKKGAVIQCLVLNNLSDLYDIFCEYRCSKYSMDCVTAINRKTKCLSKTKALSKDELDAITLNSILSQFAMAAQAA